MGIYSLKAIKSHLEFLYGRSSTTVKEFVFCWKILFSMAYFQKEKIVPNYTKKDVSEFKICVF